jgi:hypothetical protein
MTQELFTALAAPFPPDRVSWRVGSTTGDKSKGMALAYIDARDVMHRLDSTCGPAGWQCRYPHANGKTVCEVGLKVDGEWIWKADGAGDTDYEAEKGALSDAFKRAAVRWGIGRYLYDLSAPWVEVEARGKSFIIKQHETGKLRDLLARFAPPEQPPPLTQGPGPRKTSAQAKRDKEDEKIRAEIQALDKPGLGNWMARFDENTAHLPFAWLDSIRDFAEGHLEALDKPAEAHEMDEAFRATVGGRPAPLAGNNGQVASA